MVWRHLIHRCKLVFREVSCVANLKWEKLRHTLRRKYELSSFNLIAFNTPRHSISTRSNGSCAISQQRKRTETETKIIQLPIIFFAEQTNFTDLYILRNNHTVCSFDQKVQTYRIARTTRSWAVIIHIKKQSWVSLRSQELSCLGNQWHQSTSCANL